jgi:hypothetical protein
MIFEILLLNTQEVERVSNVTTYRSVLFRETLAVCCNNDGKTWIHFVGKFNVSGDRSNGIYIVTCPGLRDE